MSESVNIFLLKRIACSGNTNILQMFLPHFRLFKSKHSCVWVCVYVCFCWRTIKNRKGARLRDVLDELEETTPLVLSLSLIPEVRRGQEMGPRSQACVREQLGGKQLSPDMLTP